MKTRTNMRKEIAQAGSMMIEAMAMLALISLVTPTLYKKSAERTTELQDINTATHLRTLIKAVDNYVADHYDTKIAGKDKINGNCEEECCSNGDCGIETFDDLSVLEDYLPYGYNLDSAVKNFGQPKIALYRKGDAITSYVELPKELDVQPMRAARIASMVGSNGGYVQDGQVEGVGGTWGLTNDQLTKGLKFSGGEDSIVVTSTEAVTSATSNALENDKYLQRTKVANDGQRWRNAMATDLYMGGLAGQNGSVGDVGSWYSIYGVDRLILGGTDATTTTDIDDYSDQDLVVLGKNGENGNRGKAYIEGELRVLEDAFTVKTADNPEMLFGNDAAGDILQANGSEFDVFGGATATGTSAKTSDTGGLTIKSGDGTVKTNFATTVYNDFENTGNATIASDAETTVKVGKDGSYMTADAESVKLRITTDGDSQQMILDDTKTEIAGNTHFKVTAATTGENATAGNVVKVGGENETMVNPDNHKALNPKFEVIGNAYVNGTLNADEVETPVFDTLNLHAGAATSDSTFDEDPTTKRWLHATEAGVWVRLPNGEENGQQMLTINEKRTELADANNTASLVLTQNTTDSGTVGTASLGADDLVEIGTSTSGTNVKIQGERLIVTNGDNTGENGKDSNNRVKVGNDATFVVTKAGTKELFKASPKDSQVISQADATIVRPGKMYAELAEATAAKTKFEVQDYSGNAVFKVSPNNDDDKQNSSYVELDKTSFRVTDRPNNARILEVIQTQGIPTKIEASSYESSTKGSVYIRDGAIELRPSTGSQEYTEAGGYGYVEASRFVANNVDGSDIVTPTYAKDSTISWANGDNYGIEALPNRYMVNPAYTSVMHDIRLTTRGGARLSDILPDFINKGIYVVSNSYQETGADPTEMTASATEVTDNQSWASAYLGTVPAPLCPPGHARVITITPAGFMMAQAGRLRKDNDGKWYVENSERSVSSFDLSGKEKGSYAESVYWQKMALDDDTNNVKYFLGFTDTDVDSSSIPHPLFFQQSTWLKSKVVPQYGTVSSHSSTQSDGNFVGWNALMGFLYPEAWYSDVLADLGISTKDGFDIADSGSSLSTSNTVYWNIYPVNANTLEAYATVYCYFDRTNLYGSGLDATMTDQYDQLGSFRQPGTKDSTYVKRLNDPTLKYNTAW